MQVKGDAELTREPNQRAQVVVAHSAERVRCNAKQSQQ